MKFGFAQETAFAKDLVKGLAKQLPSAIVENRLQATSVNKITRQLERTYKAAAAYQRSNRLGFIRRAVLANSFRWELKDSGYPQAFIEVAVEGLVVELSRASKKAEDNAAAG